MALRIFGLALLVLGTALGFVASGALSDAGDMGRFLASVGDAMGEPIDAGEWTARWRSTSIGLAIVAFGAILGGLSFIARRRAGWTILAGTLAAHAIWVFVERLRRPRRYAFEAEFTQIVAAVIFAALCAWMASRSRKRRGMQSQAGRHG